MLGTGEMTSRMQRDMTTRTGDVVGWSWSGDRPDGMPPAKLPAPKLTAPKTPDPESSSWSLRRRLALGVAGLGLVAGIALGAGFLAFVAHLARSEQLPLGPSDGIVALTGGAQRIEDAMDLLAGGYGRRLLITGVNERTSRDEIARLNPGQQHLIACCVDLDYRARNTIGNAIEIRRWMRENGFRSVAVVTSNYHMPRTLVELDHALRKATRWCRIRSSRRGSTRTSGGATRPRRACWPPNTRSSWSPGSAPGSRPTPSIRGRRCWSAVGTR